MDGRVVEPNTKTLGELFDENEPFYLSIGMTHEEYWNGKPELAKSTLRAFNLKREREIEDANLVAWLQGRYNECALTNVMNGMFAKNNANVQDQYPKQPYTIFDHRTEEEKQKEAQQQLYQWAMALHGSLHSQFGSNNS